MRARRRREDHATDRSHITLGGAAWLAVLVLIGIVQIVRAQPVDTIVFAVGVVVLGVAALRTQPSPRKAPSLRAMLVAASVAVLVLGVLGRHSPAMIVAVAAVGVAALVLAWPGHRVHTEPWPPTLRRVAIWWAGIVIAGCLWELFEFIRGLVYPEMNAEAFSNLIDPLLSSVPGRIVFVVAWIALGVFLLRRGGRP